MAFLVSLLASIQHSLPHLGADYAGVGIAALLSWLGLPGIGEALLIAAAVEASRGKVAISAVLVIAWAGATVGGVGGWLVGQHFGRRLALAGHWLRQHRERALVHGNRLFERYGLVAVFFTPSWVAGIHSMSPRLYLPANAISALIWSLLFGLGAYLLGPGINDVTSDIGYAGSAAIVLLVISGIVFARRELRQRERAPSER